MKELIDAIDRKIAIPNWLIALDRDGTLVPYASSPEKARVQPALHTLINDLAVQPGVRVSVVSARSAAQLEGDFGRRRVILAGNYGMEVLFPDGSEAFLPEALSAVPQLKELRDRLACAIDLSSGAILEDHGYSLCLHWHNVPLSRRGEIHSAVNSLSDAFPQVSIRQLPSSYEMLPNVDWTKGKALNFLGSNLKLDEEVLYFFAGDTEADSPAFEWVNERGGISVRIGPGGNLGASFQLAQPEQLHAVLRYTLEKRHRIFCRQVKAS